MIKKHLVYFIVSTTFFLSALCFADAFKEIPEFTKNDRILILAPHPDDEAIATAGVIQRALKADSKIKVVCYTNGDNNELAFIVYEKRLTLRRRELIHMGEVRMRETVEAMGYLGVSKDDILFLGYPDFGTMEILTKYWGNVKPFRALSTRSSKVPYPECLSPGAPYLGESILKDLKRIIVDFKPTRIFVSSPVDTNRDHRSLYLFLQIALWDLEKVINKPRVFSYVIHVVGWPKPRGYHPELGLDPPSNLIGMSWSKLSLTPEEIKIKYDCLSFYKSQIEYDKPYLFTFARKNEIFGEHPVVTLPVDISPLAYSIQDNNLFIKLNLKRKIDKDFGISIFLLGYNKSKDFATMPKIHITVGILGMHIQDKKQRISVKDAQFIYEGNTIILKFPLTSLGDPDYILSTARSVDLPFGQTVWRIIKLE